MHKRAGARRATKSNHELRDLRQELAGVKREKRAEGESNLIRGVSAVFYREDEPGTEYWLWNDMVERIHPGAFDRAVSESHDARALFNHNSSQLLGRVSSGTCRLSVTDAGLAYEIDEDATDPDHQRVASKIDRGDVTGSSFAFIAREVQWSEVKQDDGDWLYIRNIYDLDLFDVGPVTWPAYQATTAGRSGQSPSGRVGEAGEGQNAEYRELIRERDAQLRKADDDEVAMRVRMIELDRDI
jgi:HK97 family phage prohead protease